MLCVPSHAADTNFSAGVSAELVKQKVNDKEGQQEFDVTNKVLRPFFNGSIRGRRYELSANASNDHVRRDLNGQSRSTNFVEYTVNGELNVIEDWFDVDVGGSQRYLSERLDSFIVDDFLLNGDNLSKLKNKRVGFTFGKQSPSNIRFNLRSVFNKNSSDGAENDDLQASFFNNESLNNSFELGANALNGFQTLLTGDVSRLKREGRRDYNSQRYSLINQIELYSSISLTLQGTYSKNVLDSGTSNSFQGSKEFYTMGAGLMWQVRPNRYIELTYNTSSGRGFNDQEDTDRNFVGMRLNWEFSPRTSVEGSFTRRFYGKAANFSLNHSLRNWRSSIKYTETISSSSQLVLNREPGLFICNNGAQDLSDCTLSDSLQPDLSDGQFTQSVVLRNLDINDRIILSKNYIAQTAVTRRRTTASIIVSKRESEELEIDRTYDIFNVSSKLAFEFSRYSRLVFNYDYGKIDSTREGVNLEQTINKYEIEFIKKLGSSFSVNLGYSYLNRKGETDLFNQGFRGLNGPLSENRVTLGVTYQYDSKKRR